MTNYKWTLKRIEGVYILTCFIQSIEGDWIQDGRGMIWDNLDAPLLHVRKTMKDRQLNLDMDLGVY